MTARTGPLVLVGATLVVICSVVAGVRMLRPPDEERARRIDGRRVRDLSAIVDAVETYVARERALPASLDVLAPGLVRQRATRDPESDDPYEYRVTGPRAFELCADFDEPDPSPPQGSRWAHDEGRQCFSLEVKSPDGN